MLRQVKVLVRSFLTLGPNPQNFLGSWWVPLLVRNVPVRLKRRTALRLLSLSPHYIFGENGQLWFSRAQIEREAERNRQSRIKLVNDVVRPHVRPEDTVVDYGCGPGYLAFEMAKHVRRVIACDISTGALACARVLNGASNIEYVDVDGARWTSSNKVDLVYSFAVAQHVRDGLLQEILRTLHEVLQPGGLLLMHLVVNGKGWKSEAEWLQDNSLYGRLKFKYGLHCFTRTPEQVLSMAQSAGFNPCELELMSGFTPMDEDDVSHQHLLICRA